MSPKPKQGGRAAQIQNKENVHSKQKRSNWAHKQIGLDSLLNQPPSWLDKVGYLAWFVTAADSEDVDDVEVEEDLGPDNNF